MGYLRTSANNPERFAAMADWSPKPSSGVPSSANMHGLPTVICRTPSRLIEECEQAFDDGLLLAALSLSVTIPDICARIDGTHYLDWCLRYLDLPNDGERKQEARSQTKTQKDIEEGFSVIEKSGVFTASDLYQLRCAVVHAGSSCIEEEGSGAKYSPYRVIGVCVQGNARGVVASYGYTGSGSEEQSDCAYDCVVRLEGLISLLAQGVKKFLEEDPSRDCEYSGNSKNKSSRYRCGVTDYRPLAGLGTV